MELKGEMVEKRQAYLAAYAGLMGDRRTERTFGAVVEGIIGGESLCASVIARFSPWVGGGEAWGAAGQAAGNGRKHTAQ